MDNELIIKNKISVFELFDLLNDEKVEYIYRGKFDAKITDGILSLAEINLDATSSVKIKKRVYFILVEGLQNITRHQEKVKEVDYYNEGFLTIQKNDTEFAITTGNLIQNSATQDLKSKLERINGLDKNQLKNYYRQILDNETFSQKGGAGLGLIEIARKSGNKIAYDFQKVSDIHSYFYMQTKITITENENKSEPLKNIKKIHNLFNQQNIILCVTGLINHDKLIYLLSILESNMDKKTVLKNKIFSIMIELMQNIVKHADDIEIDNVVGKHSVFFLTNNDHEIALNSGNYIKNEKIERLKNHIERINTMSHKELNKFHFDTLVNYKKEEDIAYGLGLLDMRIKSRKKMFFDFQKIDETYSFFSIRVSLNHDLKKKKVLKIEKTPNTPEVVLDEKNGQFTFCGNSFPESATVFYSPILKWIEKYAENPRLFTSFEFKFKLLSTATQKQLIKVFRCIEKIADLSAVVVKWYYEKNNEDALNFGMEFSKLFNIDFKLMETDELPC